MKRSPYWVATYTGSHVVDMKVVLLHLCEFHKCLFFLFLVCCAIFSFSPANLATKDTYSFSPVPFFLCVLQNALLSISIFSDYSNYTHIISCPLHPSNMLSHVKVGQQDNVLILLLLSGALGWSSTFVDKNNQYNFECVYISIYQVVDFKFFVTCDRTTNQTSATLKGSTVMTKALKRWPCLNQWMPPWLEICRRSPQVANGWMSVKDWYPLDSMNGQAFFQQ